MSEEDDQRQSDIPDFNKWDGYISGKRNYRLNPLPTEKEILAKYFEIRPTVDSDNLCLDLIVLETGRKKETVANIIHKNFVKEEAKAQRKQIAEEVYADKIPAIQSIIGLSLSKLENFVTGFTPANIEDAKGLSKIATDLNGILRLELGKSTQNIEVVQRTEKSVTVLLEELKQNDPFVEYPALPHDSKNSPLRDALDETNIILGKFHAYLKSRNTFPHKDQSEVIRAFFNDKKKIIQGQCGRSFGKTHVILYIAWRFALTNPGSEVYIVCPENAQGKRIYWISRRLQTYGNQEFVSEHRDSELRTVFKNGSHIMIVGCENYEALRGIKPHLVIYDEFQHHSSFFDEEVMQPNLSSGKVSLVVMGTPPKRHCYYVEFRKQLLDNIQSGDRGCYYVELPSTCNPTVDKIWVHKKKIELQKKGKINVYLREYEGKLLFDTEHAIFPFFDEFKHKKPHAYIMELLKRDKRKLDWYTFYDPGTASVFGGLFIAVNRYTSQIFILDEIYATEKNKMTARSIWVDSEQKRKELFADSSAWSNYYDEAETWFANEINSMFNVGLIPTHKSQYESRRSHDEGRAGESILNELMMLENRFFVSDRCIKFIWELTNYVTDEQGKYPRKHDHLMDLLIYFINEAHFELYEEVDYEGYEESRKRETFRGETLEQMMSGYNRKKDITYGIEPDYYDDMGDEYGWN